MKYENETYDEERALYGQKNISLINCMFDGPADGESALKECSTVHAKNCDFRLRYPFWHVDDALLENCRMSDTCRAALWYDHNTRIKNSTLDGIKALRECDDTTLIGCDIRSAEFGWLCRDMHIENCTLTSEYPFFQSSDIEATGLHMKAKYSFQYVRNVVIRNSELDTKDAFWHSENVTVYDSVVKGEYLGWYAKNLRLVRCKIIGTQPLCYSQGVVLEDCTMEGCDLSFERSEVTAYVVGGIDSIKNPSSGTIFAETIGEVIMEPPYSNENAVTIVTA